MTDWLQSRLGLSPELQLKLLSTVLTVFGLWLLHRLALAFVYRRVRSPWSRYRWRKGITYVAYGLGVILVGRTWFVGIREVATFLGLIGAGLAVALKDPVTNLAGWVFILWRRPFEVGDRIEIGGNKGDVIDIHLQQFTLNEIGNWVDADQSSGRIIHVPNGRVFTEPLANYDRGFRYIWNEVPVLVTFESDWRKAKEILTRIAVKHAEHLTAQAEQDLLTASRQYLINYTKLTPIVYTKVIDSGVQLTLRYLIEPRKRRGTEHAIWEDVLTEFDQQPEVDLAYRAVVQAERGGQGRQAAAVTAAAQRGARDERMS
jgi:small-conductance mechanosensitive channel